MCHQRAEHSVVVAGAARGANGDKTSLLTKNDSTYVSFGTIRDLKNLGYVLPEVIKVQSGYYLGE